MKNFFFNPNFYIRKWYIIDANKKQLGYISNEISKLLIGKYNYYNLSNKNLENFVIVINAKNILYKKIINKNYYLYNQKPGNLKKFQYKEIKKKFSEKLLFKAVSNMIPKNILGKNYLKYLYIYSKNNILYYKKK